MPAERSEQPRIHARRRSLLRGVRLGVPILLGYLPVGIAFGIVAREVGFSPAQSILCSATAIAGAGQFIALALLKSGATVATILIATGIVNLRYLLFGATLSPHVARVPLVGQSFLAFTLTDETFAVNSHDLCTGRADGYSMAGVGIIAWTGWVGSTALGALAAGFIGDPTRWGVQFAMPAMFTALLIGQAETRRHALVGLLAGALAIAGMLVLPDRWHVIAAPVIAAAIATVADR